MTSIDNATLRELFMAGQPVTALARAYGISTEQAENIIRYEWFKDRLNHLEFLERIEALLTTKDEVTA